MRFLLSFFSILFLFCGLTTNAQKHDTYYSSPILQSNRVAFQNGLQNSDRQWDVQLKSFAASANKSSVSEAEMEKLRQLPDHHAMPQISRMRSNPARLNVNYEGNRGTGSVPPDNTIAVSTNGFVISGINSNLFFSRTDGTVIYTQALADFFTDLGLGAGYFDPRVYFDVVSKRFIVVALSGSESNVSSVCIAFSENEDPSLGWHFYKLKGDVLSESLWFDYPNIAVTDQELYITGNMFSDANQFRYSTILQVNKENGYRGEALTYKFYAKMKEPTTNQFFFNVTPVTSGWTQHKAGGIRFLTNDPRGGSNITVLCQTSGTLNENPEFEILDVKTGDGYDVSPTVPQKGTTNVLQTGDCRIQYAVELNGVIHFVLKAKINNKAGLYFGRYDLTNNKLYTKVYAETDMHVSYPSLAPMGKDESDSRMLVQYLRSSDAIFPEQVAMVLEGNGSDFIFSEPIVIRDGDSFVNALDANNERWGDYSCVSRRFFNGLAETWTGGCFGRVRFGTWIGQFIPADQDFRDIFADKTVINEGDTIQFSYVGTDSLTSLTWLANGGVFTDSISARYDSLGSYPLEIRATNSRGDSVRLIKENFIHVVPRVITPIAQFEADKTLAFEGDTIQFFDRSENEPVKWKWTLTGASPSSSAEQNPKVVYSKKGQYNVVLNAKNSAGEDVEVKQKFIKIEAKIVAPVANFMADKRELIEGDSVQFTDLSINQPTAWQWLIEGIETDTLTTQNPVFTFDKAGSYNVQLTASNSAGFTTKREDAYIVVGTASTKDAPWINTTKFYPNPVITDKFYLTFELNQSEKVKFEIISTSGTEVKTLLNKEVKAGRNEISFNADMLASGHYFLKLSGSDERHIVAIPFVVAK